MRVTVTSAPAAEPITSTEAKAYLRVDHSADDTLIADLTKAARVVVEEHLRRSLVTQTRRATYDAREAAPPFVLPYGPVSSITSVETWDTATDAWVAADTSSYTLSQDRVFASEEPGAASWPDVDRDADALRVTYVAGYGAYTAVPDNVRAAVRLVLLDFYERRAPGPLGDGVRMLLAPYVNHR